MRRLEYKDAKSHKFWELSVEGDSYTVRYGKVGAAGQTQTKTFASASRAEAEGTKKLQQKLKKGYAEVEIDAAAAAAAARGQPARNPALEEALFDDFGDTAAWAVYGDWLQQQQDDPYGERVALEVQRETAKGSTKAKLTKRINELDEEHQASWMGPSLAKLSRHEKFYEIATLTWERGFITSASVGEHETYEWTGPNPDAILRALVKSTAARFLRELSIGPAMEDWMASMEKGVQAITKAGKLEALKQLVIDDPKDYWDISSLHVGDVSRLFPVLPRLETIMVRGANIGIEKLELPHLRSLDLVTGGLPSTTGYAVGRCQLPELTSMNIYFGSSEYGARGSNAMLTPLYAGKGVPKLTRLGLKNAEFQDAIATSLAKSKVLAQLTHVDLSLGTMTDKGAGAILKAASKFAGLEGLDLSRNFISDEMCARLKQALPKVVVSGQELADEWDGRAHYYVSVGE